MTYLAELPSRKLINPLATLLGQHLLQQLRMLAIGNRTLTIGKVKHGHSTPRFKTLIKHRIARDASFALVIRHQFTDLTGLANPLGDISEGPVISTRSGGPQCTGNAPIGQGGCSMAKVRVPRQKGRLR